MTSFRAMGAALCAAALTQGPAHGQPITASDPEGVAAALSELGYRAKVGMDSVGDPMITSAASGLTFAIFFYGCTKNADCLWLKFDAGVHTDIPMTAADANAWNRKRLFGTMTVDADGDPSLSHFTTTQGGIGRETFADIVDWWQVALGQFGEFVASGPTGGAGPDPDSGFQLGVPI